MKKASVFLATGLLLVFFFATTYAGEKAPQKIVDLAHNTLATEAYLVQVSVPVKDGDKVIGAIPFGINIDKFGK
jgi:hypothetical protein